MYNEINNEDSLLNFFQAPDQSECIIRPDFIDSTANQIMSVTEGYQKSAMERYDLTAPFLDTIKHWHHKSKVIKVSPNKYWFHNLLTKFDNRLLKMITKGNLSYSYLAGDALMKRLLKIAEQMTPEEFKEQCQNMQDNPESDEAKEMQKQMLSAANSALNETRKKVKQAENSQLAGKNPGTLENIKLLTNPAILKSISLNRKDINKFVKHIVSKATQSIGGVSYIQEESLLDSDDIEDLANIENFAHVALIEDLAVRHKKYTMNFDIYLDDSGSMSDSMKLESGSIKYRLLSRVLAKKMQDMNLLKDAYLFSSHTQLEKLPKDDFFSMKIDGGTDIQQCIDNAKKMNRPCIILTDGYDRLTGDMFDQVYFLILGDPRMDNSFMPYYEKKRIMYYDEGKFYPPYLYESQNYNKEKIFSIQSSKNK
tara:strand:- start:5536 stop:6807 length:1272 start_codon:yes stop_codon:yes gene_type:complete